MKKWIIVLICLMLIGCATTQHKLNPKYANIKRVIVLPFYEPSNPTHGMASTDLLISFLTQYFTFDVVDWTQLTEEQQKKFFTSEKMLTKENFQELSQVFQVDAVFTGSSIVSAGGALFNLKLIDAHSGTLLVSWSARRFGDLRKLIYRTLK